jgi:hypothetical protein
VTGLALPRYLADVIEAAHQRFAIAVIHGAGRDGAPDAVPREPDDDVMARAYDLARDTPEPFFWRMSPDVLDAIKAEAASDGHEWSLEPVKIIGRRYVVDADLPPGTLIASTDWRCRSHGELLGERRYNNAEYDTMTGEFLSASLYRHCPQGHWELQPERTKDIAGMAPVWR